MDECIKRATARAELMAAYEDGRIATIEDILAVLDLVPAAEDQSTILTADSSARLAAIKDIPTQRLLDLAIAERNGRLEVQPCKVGDVVWVIRDYHGHPHPQQGVVSEVYCLNNLELQVVVKHIGRGAWGKKVFATRQKAEAAMERMNGGICP